METRGCFNSPPLPLTAPLPAKWPGRLCHAAWGSECPHGRGELGMNILTTQELGVTSASPQPLGEVMAVGPAAGGAGVRPGLPASGSAPRRAQDGPGCPVNVLSAPQRPLIFPCSCEGCFHRGGRLLAFSRQRMMKPRSEGLIPPQTGACSSYFGRLGEQDVHNQMISLQEFLKKKREKEKGQEMLYSSFCPSCGHGTAPLSFIHFRGCRAAGTLEPGQPKGGLRSGGVM